VVTGSSVITTQTNSWDRKYGWDPGADYTTTAFNISSYGMAADYSATNATIAYDGLGALTVKGGSTGKTTFQIANGDGEINFGGWQEKTNNTHNEIASLQF
jgi:hypothetical protein